MENNWIHSNIDLLYINSDREDIVCIKNSGSLEMDFFVYANNFFRAGEEVINYLLSDASENCDIKKLDLWYYSMIFLYRHSIELLLKAIIFQEVKDLNKIKASIGEIRHDLYKAFKKIIELKKLDLDLDNIENLNWLKKFLKNISNIDKESDMFRYPFDMNKNVLFSNQTHISLLATKKNFCSAFKNICSIYYTGKILNENINTVPKMIAEGGSYYQQSVVGYKHRQKSFYPYYTSYIEVGNFLKDCIIKLKKECLFIPMCYLYRNAIELSLKRLIVEDIVEDDIKKYKILKKKKHSILALWNSIKDELKKYDNGTQALLEISYTAEYIKKIHDYDLNSDKFRYPCNNKIESYFLEETKFDINNVTSCFQELCDYLDAVDTMINVVKDIEY